MSDSENLIEKPSRLKVLGYCCSKTDTGKSFLGFLIVGLFVVIPSVLISLPLYFAYGDYAGSLIAGMFIWLGFVLAVVVLYFLFKVAISAIKNSWMTATKLAMQDINDESTLSDETAVV
jgi:chromate transport protein ChrA